jgi:hypothetical protein
MKLAGDNERILGFFWGKPGETIRKSWITLEDNIKMDFQLNRMMGGIDGIPMAQDKGRWWLL